MGALPKTRRWFALCVPHLRPAASSQSTLDRPKRRRSKQRRGAGEGGFCPRSVHEEEESASLAAGGAGGWSAKTLARSASTSKGFCAGHFGRCGLDLGGSPSPSVGEGCCSGVRCAPAGCCCHGRGVCMSSPAAGGARLLGACCAIAGDGSRYCFSTICGVVAASGLPAASAGLVQGGGGLPQHGGVAPIQAVAGGVGTGTGMEPGDFRGGNDRGYRGGYGGYGGGYGGGYSGGFGGYGGGYGGNGGGYGANGSYQGGTFGGGYGGRFDGGYGGGGGRGRGYRHEPQRGAGCYCSFGGDGGGV
ncbi:hypothetical protein BRADI_5g01933v3 [Brachypodium distachyon]|uniref:Uncharacterized protein n=1 Tax=Brachypodium distachyon TaxID=15368 RepID=A0A0Q3KP16_BRADI|nr:hypothetical protein BRADI_5g01933v3 [Brachypodium distachyon]